MLVKGGYDRYSSSQTCYYLIILAIVHVAQVSDVAPVSLVNVLLLISNYSNVTM